MFKLHEKYEEDGNTVEEYFLFLGNETFLETFINGEAFSLLSLEEL